MPDMTRSCTPQSGATTPIFPPSSSASSLLLLPTATKVLSVATSTVTCSSNIRTSCSLSSTLSSFSSSSSSSSSKASVTATTTKTQQQQHQQQQQKKGTQQVDNVTCFWKNCNKDVDACGIIEHVRQCHVDTQRDCEVFVCLWEGCKVFNKTSCSKTWLERHILCHGGDKPFRCIVDGCRVRFTSQSALERHVNSHFNTYQPISSRGAKSKEDTPTKLMKKRKLKKGRVCTGRSFGIFKVWVLTVDN